MNTAGRITSFTAALAVSFGAAYGLGNTVGPLGGTEPAPQADHMNSTASEGSGDGSDPAPSPPGGLQISEGGYTLDLFTPRLKAAQEGELRFAVRDRPGRPVTAYQREHDKELHLILASRDLATYRHLHPTRAADGTWSTPVTLPAAGDYRVFADFTPGARNAPDLTLGADLAVSGAYKPAELPKPSRTATVDGYTVTLNGTLRPGAAEDLRLDVSRGGRPVTDLQRHLAAYGHLVALRAGDLAHLHVHPTGEPGDGSTETGPEVSFTATAPSSGTYRLFLDFKHNGTVRTAAFTVRAGAAPFTPRPAEPTTEHEDGGHTH
ncbi:hypothetical protein [Streptomyces sp. NBC_00887]|uniref:hypothetical protein n=1 Tax=Streptomyces sp. NBC_00887 TaxID=2975859 RepID=UPI00386E38D8|nr:hypothetical protein OG844_04490 [Streptomyces sp. NBC_00887]WSY35656.1 hypothetical protein OG844_41110 [Streptomyces sp. NBC_00887]